MSMNRLINIPLHVHPVNHRFLSDASGRAIYLTGSHTWATVQDRRLPETPVFDYEKWLDYILGFGHNFLRLWVWEHAAWMQFSSRKIEYSPCIYERTGPGTALDGKPKFNVKNFNEEFFLRLRQRVEKAADRGMYVSVMLFQGFSLYKATEIPGGKLAYKGHPFNKENNINGLDGDPNRSGCGLQVHTLDNPAVTELQEKYVRKVIDTLNDIDYLVWEIANEAFPGSVQWQYHFIRFIKEYEGTKSKQHLIGMTGAPIKNNELRMSVADWISPTYGDGFNHDIPENDGRQVIIIDTDHIDVAVAYYDLTLPWRSLFRGNNFIYMDRYKDARIGSPREPNSIENGIRRQMGYARRFSEAIDLAKMIPYGSLSTSGHCLAAEDDEYATYLPFGNAVYIDLSKAQGDYSVIWFGCNEGEWKPDSDVKGGAMCWLTNPFFGHAAVIIKKLDL